MRVNLLIASVIVAALPGSTVAAPDKTIPQNQFAEEIADKSVSFIATDLRTDLSCQLEGSDLQTRHAPWSTFKIPNFLIAMDTGAVEGPDVTRTWDQTRRPASAFWPAAWRKDQTLRTAFQVSAVWYFQDIALAVGSDHYQQTLNAWRYGTATLPEGSDDFWLNNGLEISVQEQIDFLTALHRRELGVSDKAFSALTGVSHAWSGLNVTLHGKTVSGPRGDRLGGFEGWYIGWVARPDTAPTVFALYATAPHFWNLRDFRKSFAITLLQTCGFLPAR